MQNKAILSKMYKSKSEKKKKKEIQTYCLNFVHTINGYSPLRKA